MVSCYSEDVIGMCLSKIGRNVPAVNKEHMANVEKPGTSVSCTKQHEKGPEECKKKPELANIGDYATAFQEINIRRGK